MRKKITISPPISISPSKDFIKKYDLHHKEFDRCGNFKLIFSDLHKVGTDYLDLIAKVRKIDFKKNQVFQKYACARGFLVSKCSCGANKAKLILCGFEYCPDCGKKFSPVHCRRINRWYGKVMTAETVGMFTITIPVEARVFFHRVKCECNTYEARKKRRLADQDLTDLYCEKCNYTGYKRDLLRDFRNYCTSHLRKQFGMDKGLLRYHWSGDCKACHGEGCVACKFTGSKNVWHPHLHILHDLGYIDNEKIQKFRHLAKKWIERKTGLSLPYDITVHNEYTNIEGKKFHLLAYVTRATWRDPENVEVIQTIKGFRTTNTWGKWAVSLQHQANELTLLEKCVCPECAKPIKWDRMITIRKFFASGKVLTKEILGGYYSFMDLNDRINLRVLSKLNDTS